MTIAPRCPVVLLIALLAAALCLSATPAPAAPAPAASAASAASAPGAVQVRVLQYNIRYGSRGLDNVARDIARTGAQVVLLNEVDDRRRTGGVHQARYLARKLGMRSVYDANIRTRLGLRGNAVLSAYPIGTVRRFDLFVPPGTRPRGLMRARIATRGVRFDVWTTHLNVGRGTLRQAKGVTARLGDPGCATVLGGDMNAGPGSPEDRSLRTHLRDVWRETGHGSGPTNFRGTQRIDYLYVDHVTPRASWATPLRASDHRGVVGVLRIGRGQGC